VDTLRVRKLEIVEGPVVGEQDHGREE
jgi:hypothetical protein